MARRRVPADRPLTVEEREALLDAAFADLDRVVLAVSGGADSIALLTLAADWRAARPDGPELHVATVAHGLRPEAEAEIAAVARLAAAAGLPHARLDAATPPGPSVEERARADRYAALGAHAAALRADAITTAHTQDDQAETVLMRLAAGSGPAGLAAMRPRLERPGGLLHLRPLLGVPKARLAAGLRDRGLDWAEDAMNADPAYLRARLRRSRRILEREGLTAERLATLASRMARAEAALEAAVDAAAAAHLVIAGGRAVLAAEAAGLPDEVRLRLLGRAVAAVGSGPIRLERLERLAKAIDARPSGAATLAGARIVCRQGEIVVAVAPPRRSTAKR